MSSWKEKYLLYTGSVRRYSPRTVAIYGEVLDSFESFCGTPAEESLLPQIIRSYEVDLLKRDSARTVHLHLSVLSGFSKYLVKLFNTNLSVHKIVKSFYIKSIKYCFFDACKEYDNSINSCLTNRLSNADTVKTTVYTDIN